MNLKQPTMALTSNMSRNEALQVLEWCRDNELLQPQIKQSNPGYYYLSWRHGIQEDCIHTSSFKAARHWCAFMKIEFDAGVPGYWEVHREEGLDLGDDGPLFSEAR